MNVVTRKSNIGFGIVYWIHFSSAHMLSRWSTSRSVASGYPLFARFVVRSSLCEVVSDSEDVIRGTCFEAPCHERVALESKAFGAMIRCKVASLVVAAEFA